MTATDLTPPPASQSASFAPVFWLLVGGVFAAAINTQIMSPILPAVGEEFDASVGRAGIAITAYLLPYGLVQLFYGPLADRVGRVSVIAFALGTSAIATLLCGIAPSLETLIIFRAAAGMTVAAITSLTLTYVGDTVPYIRRHRAIGYTAMATSLGNISAAMLGGLAVTLINWRTAFFLIAAGSAVLTILIFRQPEMRSRPQGETWSWLAPLQALLTDRRHFVFYLLIMIEGISVFGAFGYFGYVLRERDDLSYFVIGVLLAIFGLASAAAGRSLGTISDRLNERQMVITGGLVTAAGYALFTVPPALPVSIIALAAVGGGMIVMHTTFQMRATELMPDARATGITTFALALFLGASIGSTILSQAFDLIGINPSLLALAGFMVIFATVSSRILIAVTRPHAAEAVRYTESASL